MSDKELKQTIKRLEECLSSFVQGDPEPYKAFWSHGADMTIFGAWGAYEVGWDVVRPRLEWAAARFTGGRARYEPLALSSSGDLAVAVGIERSEARVVGEAETRPMVLRVTH